MLVALHGGPMCVGQLARSVGISSSATSYHVRLMLVAGLVVAERAGGRTQVRRVERRWDAIVTALVTE
jgi:DNA-binding transcriptional ArsR family regulator